MGGYAVVRFLLGLLLLIAAALKGDELATGQVLADGLFASKPLWIAVVEFELVMGLWLLAGGNSRWAWWVAVLLFMAYAYVSLYKALSGHATCGCFGWVQTSPWWTLGLDTLAVVGLLRLRPAMWDSGHAMASGDRHHSVPRFRLALVVSCVLVVGAPSAVVMASYRPAILASDSVITGGGRLLVLEPDKLAGKPLALIDTVWIWGGAQKSEFV